MNHMEYYCSTVKELELPATKLKELVEDKNYKVVFLEGEMGTGKTTFTRCFVSLFKKTLSVNSPTFNLMNEYKINSGFSIYHFDLYRIRSHLELESLEFDEYWNGNGISLIEWPLHVREFLKTPPLIVRLEMLSYDRRKITIVPPDMEGVVSFSTEIPD